MVRTFSPYELAHLRKFGKAEVTPENIGEMPVEYVTGRVEFCREIFMVTPDTMIPRVETEELVEIIVSKVFEEFPQPSISICDVGTGSGAIGISLAKKIAPKKNCQLSLVDISSKAVAVARENAQAILKHEQLNNSVTTEFFQSNLLAAIPQEKKFDIIVANLPYIPSDRIESLDTSVKDFEPHLALDGGPQGLTLIHTFLKQVPNYLTPNGLLFLEIDYTHKLTEIIAGTHTLTGTVERDSFNRHRFALLKLRTDAETPLGVHLP